MEIFELTERSLNAIETLTALWRKSVASTHKFLSASEIDAIEPEVKTGLKNVKNLVVVVALNGEFCAFMGSEKRRLEMLFVLPKMQGKGIGKKLVEFAIEKYNVASLTVNEQNLQAMGFYEHLGFKPYKRTPCDEQGRPYPLIYMKL